MESARARVFATKDPMSFGFGSDDDLPCRVESVYDGDTVTITFPCGGLDGPIVKHSMRISGIDAPEKFPRKNSLKPGFATREEEQEAAAWSERMASEWCRKHQDLQMGLLRVRCAPESAGMDKYGRMLGDLFDADTGTHSLAAFMVECGAAVPYENRNDESAWRVARRRRQTTKS